MHYIFRGNFLQTERGGAIQTYFIHMGYCPSCLVQGGCILAKIFLFPGVDRAVARFQNTTRQVSSAKGASR